jgi:histidinol-phosphate/aromatic aminotransferase/cobyric acid decarboxylase-like protein
MNRLNRHETALLQSIHKLKEKSGAHSPSVHELIHKKVSIDIQIDACFLSNPYATDLFLSYFQHDLLSDLSRLRRYLENYPSQNRFIAEMLSGYLQMPANNIFVGNGSSELIQAALHYFTRDKMIVILPTFSSYYEFVQDGVEVIFYRLDKQKDFELDPEVLIDLAKREKPNTVVLINPNNPNGGYLTYEQVGRLLHALSRIQGLENIILDESFIHFSYEDPSLSFQSASSMFNDFRARLIIIKSMSKDFGVAGIRAGYAIMDQRKIDLLLKTGYLWNISGLAQYFFELFTEDAFLKAYKQVRVRYIQETQAFFKILGTIDGIKTYPSLANFALIELLGGLKADEFFARMLLDFGVYTRNCDDKIGLDGEFIRVASRKKHENDAVIRAIQTFLRNRQS